MQKGAPHGLVFSSMQAMNTRRIEAGILDSGSDFDISMTPYEAGLERFVDLSKKAFIGSGFLKGWPLLQPEFSDCAALRPPHAPAI